MCLEEGFEQLGSNGANQSLRLWLSCPRGLEECERLREQSWEKAGPPQRLFLSPSENRAGPRLSHKATEEPTHARQDLHETLRQNKPTDVREGNQVMRRVREAVTGKETLFVTHFLGLWVPAFSPLTVSFGIFLSSK